MHEEPLLHDRVRRHLSNYLSNPSHALLLTGANGIGKSLILEGLARELLHRGNVDVRNFAAIRYIEPDDKQTISIETIQNLRQFTKIQPTHDSISQVVIVRDAECMSNEAETALLKLLEEPPRGVVILMSCISPSLLLATIRSRVTHIEVIPPTKKALSEYFKLEIETPEFQKAYSLSQGVVGFMQMILKADDNTIPLEDVKSFIGLSLYQKLTHVDAMSKDRGAALQFLVNLQTLYRVLCRAHALRNDAAGVRYLTDRVQAIQIATEAISANANIKLQLDSLILSL